MNQKKPKTNQTEPKQTNPVSSGIFNITLHSWPEQKWETSDKFPEAGKELLGDACSPLLNF